VHAALQFCAEIDAEMSAEFGELGDVKFPVVLLLLS